MDSGNLHCNLSGLDVPFQISVGFNFGHITSIVDHWSKEKRKVIDKLLSDNPGIASDSVKLNSAALKYNLADAHWDWLGKSLAMNGTQYEWFYLIADGSVQAVCITYHPTPSRFDSQNIFYIDYIASAYWNRDYPGHGKRFSSTGRRLITHAIVHFLGKGYRPGFSLHSLPSAEPFYTHLGMSNFGKDASKQNLTYFEASEVVAGSLMRADSHV